jgi:excisionase family DNA binding protein
VIKLYTVGEVAEKLKVHVQTVYRWTYSHKLKSSKIGGVVRINEEDYLNFIKNKNK